MNKFWLGLLPGEHVDVVKSIMVFSENSSWDIMAYHGIFVSFIDVNLIYDEEIFQNIFLHGRHFKSISSRLRSGNFNIFSNHCGHLKLNTPLVTYNEEISKTFATKVDNVRVFLAV